MGLLDLMDPLVQLGQSVLFHLLVLLDQVVLLDQEAHQGQ